MIRKTLFSIAAAALLVVPKVHAQTNVDLELALLVDVSGSVDPSEFALQRTGYVNAFGAANSSFWDDLETSGRSVAVSFTYWAGATQQSQLSGSNTWFLITDAASAQTFADAINGFARPDFGSNPSTAPGSAINYIVPRFASNGFAGDRQVIDVSGDGCQNQGDNTDAASDAAITAGIENVNGLVIGAETNSGCGSLSLSDWYAGNIVKGGGFLESSNSFDDFPDAINRKIGREVGGTVPEPATMTLLATGLLAMAGASRRRRNNKS